MSEKAKKALVCGLSVRYQLTPAEGYVVLGRFYNEYPVALDKDEDLVLLTEDLGVDETVQGSEGFYQHLQDVGYEVYRLQKDGTCTLYNKDEGAVTRVYTAAEANRRLREG